MLPHLPLGPLVIPSYPFLALIGLWTGMWLAAREAQRSDIDGDHIYNMGLYGLLAGLLGGRAWYVATHWEAYASDLTQALALTANAISPLEAVIIALIVALVYAKRHKLPLPELADAIAPGAALALTIGGVGAFLGSQTVGTLTNVPWGVTMFGQVRHPAHLYLVIATSIIFGIIWQIRLRSRWLGFVFLLFLELYAGSRLLLDPFFASPQTFGAGLRTVQVSALIVMVIVLVIMMRLEQRHHESQHSQVNT